jgi:tetratricopeptide (TPR) repeat protein
MLRRPVRPLREKAAIDRARILGAAALVRLGCRNPLDAEDAFRGALAAGPDDAQALYFYGRACIEWGRKEEAARLFRRAADLDPDDAGYLNTLLAAYLGLGWATEAETTARESLARCERELALHPEFTAAKFAAAGEALEPLRQGSAVTSAGSLKASPGEYKAHTSIQREPRFLGIESSAAFVRAP